MKKLFLILSFIPLVGVGQKILSKTTITNDTIVECCKYYEDGRHTATTYRHHEEWIDTIIVYYDIDGDTSYSNNCELYKIYNNRNQLSLKYWSCVDGNPGDYDLYSEAAIEFLYDEKDRLIEKRECLGETDREDDNCYDDMLVTYYKYNLQNSLTEKIVVIRQNRYQFWRDTVFKKIETIQKRIRYDYDMYGNNIRITKFNASAEVISTDIMTYKNNLLQKKESMAEDTIVIDYQYDQDDKIIGVEESMEAFGYYYYYREKFNHIGQLIFTAEPDGSEPGLHYEYYYQYNTDGNLIYENCYEIKLEFLNNCNTSVYSYNSNRDLIKRTDYYIDEYELDKIGVNINSYELIDKINNSDVNIRKLYKEKSVTNIKYEYY